jgi:hypothetical protein
VNDSDAALLLAEFGQDVAVLRWPSQDEARASLARRSVPRLLLVEAGAQPPSDGDCLEDWTRLPANAEDIRVRLRTLANRAAEHSSLPELDEFGQLSYRGRRAQLSPTEERIIRRLLEDFGSPVDDAELAALGWPQGAPNKGALRVHLSRARRRIEPVGLEILSRRNVGHLIQESDV